MTDPSPFSLSGTVAAVVGTSPNIGTGIALQLAAAGARVACIDRDPSMAKNAAAEVTDQGGEAIAVTCDVTSEEDVLAALATIRSELGLLEILVNGPVRYLEKSLRQMTLADWRGQLAVLLDGTFLFTKHTTEALIEAGKPGAVINLISTAGHQGETGNIGYTTAKGGLLNMTRAAAMELAPYGIRVNSLTPTATDVEEGVERAVAWGRARPERRGRLLDFQKMVPTGQLPSPRHYAKAAVFLASDDAEMITGFDLRVDAGAIAKYWPWIPHA